MKNINRGKMKKKRTNALFEEGAIWKEKTSDAHIVLGAPKEGAIPCFLVHVKPTEEGVFFEKKAFWCTAYPSAIFAHFIKIL